MTIFIKALLILSLLNSILSCSRIDDPSLHPKFDASKKAPALPGKPATPHNPQRSLFFGDLHIHTGLSTDAFSMGVRAEPDDAYLFAKGGVIEHGAGYPIQIARALDFAAVTDHSEYLGMARLGSMDLDLPLNKRTLRDLLLNGNRFSITKAWLQTTLGIKEHGFGQGEVNPDIVKDAWQLTIDSAEKHNQPGIFTAFIGYEWSAFGDLKEIHLHRNIIYRSSNVSVTPFSSLDSNRPEDLWRFLEKQNQQGKTSFAIPHNGNLSNGLMYQKVDSDNKPLTAAYSSMRNKYEPISEILQIKGQSETHPTLSPNDEFADFEIHDSLSSGGTMKPKGAYARDALRQGIELSHSEGFNPYKFGVIGSSDSHNASTPAEEDNYHGKLPIMDGSAALRTNETLLIPDSVNPVRNWGSAGLAAVWAEENTRASLFDALKRKETFATSGPRISLRFFGGWYFNKAILKQTDLIKQAYSKGVPMGGNLSEAPNNTAPSFIVLAAKDPIGANLDRIQIIKAWVDKNGKSHETVFNVAASDNRTADKNNKLTPLNSTVNIKTASYTNSLGAAQLTTVWSDPQFNPSQEAFYYARAIEIQTPRWSTYDALTLGIEPTTPATLQERAISSAIWYQP